MVLHLFIQVLCRNITKGKWSSGIDWLQGKDQVFWQQVWGFPSSHSMSCESNHGRDGVDHDKAEIFGRLMTLSAVSRIFRIEALVEYITINLCLLCAFIRAVQGLSPHTCTIHYWVHSYHILVNYCLFPDSAKCHVDFFWYVGFKITRWIDVTRSESRDQYIENSTIYIRPLSRSRIYHGKIADQ